MSFQPTDDLARAMAALTVQAVWQRCQLPDVPREGNHLVKSPFRDDKKKSFSIFAKGSAFKDQATGDKGGVWQFVALAKPGLEKKEIADLLIEWSGISRTIVKRTAVPLPAAAGPASVPNSAAPLPSSDGPGSVHGSASQTVADQTEAESQRIYIEKAAKRLKKMDEVRKAEAALLENRRRALEPSIRVREIGEWSEVVRDRFCDNDAWDPTLPVPALALDRGWPVTWVWWLISEGLLAWPRVPWAVPLSPAGAPASVPSSAAQTRADRRSVAFRVDVPVYRAVQNHQEVSDLRPVGYHQRFEINGERSWVYVPYLPAPERVRSDFQRAMVAIELERGGVVGEAVVPGLPFFMGCLGDVRFLVVAEGQWDAVTFAGAAGWLDHESAWPMGAAVMGVRGANGFDTMLAYWKEWLFWEEPAVLVLADNDAAGLKWSEAAPVPLGHAPAPTYTEKLLHAGARRVQVHRVRKEIGKDFNDYWKARRPKAQDIAEWLRELGFADAEGAWI